MSSSPPQSSSASTASLEQNLTTRLSLDPSTHIYPSDPPTLTITCTSHFTKPITLYTWGTLLDPRLALMQQQFTITDLTTGEPVKQASIMIQRMPVTRKRGSADDKFFLTLHPGVPVSVSGVFGPTNYPAMAMSDPERKQSEGRKAKRSMQVQGVDGLERGRNYKLSVNSGARSAWWDWGTRDDILVPPGSGAAASLGEGAGRISFGAVNEVDFNVQ